MPMRPPRVCGCGLKVAAGEMCICQRTRKAKAERERPTARQRGYTGKWERESKAWLAKPEHKFCACGCGRLADMVDHIIAHKGDPRLFWNRANWQPMNHRCNSRKAAKQEGGFGNSPAQAPARQETFMREAGTAVGDDLSAVRVVHLDNCNE